MASKASTFLLKFAVSFAALAGIAAFTIPAQVSAATNAARIVYAIGDVSATDSGGTRRAVKKGDFIVSGDTVVTTRGRAQLKLTDGGFVALNPNTEYAIEDYEYEEAAPAKGRSFFNLLKGGVRMVTGAIGRSNKSGWRMRTSVATIGIRGTSGYFRYIDDSGALARATPFRPVTLSAGDAQGRRLSVTVDGGEFTWQDADSGLQGIMGPGEWVCDAGCLQAANGAGQEEDGGYFVIPEQDEFESADDQVSDADVGPIPAGPAPDGTHILVSFPFIEVNPSFPSFGPPTLLNSLADGEDTDGMLNNGLFGSLDEFEWFTGFPCETCIFTRNGGQEIVDAAPDGSTFSNTYAAEWGRVIENWNVQDAFGAIQQVTGHFTWIATLEPTPDSELPTTGIMVYDKDIGGTLAALTAGPGTFTEAADVRTSIRIEVDYGNAGLINDFRIEVPVGGFPSGAGFVLQSNQPTAVQINSGFLNFNSLASTITVPAGSAADMAAGNTGMCNSGCTFFGTAVFGPAGLASNGVAAKAVTGAYQGNTNQFSYPPFSVNGAFIVED